VLRLVTIPISHYCEKARWALDRAGLRYREERHVQVVHRLASWRAGGSGTTPVLVTPEGPIGESAQILRWVDERTAVADRLFPCDADERREVRALCERLDDRLGPSARRLIYAHAFARPELMLDYNNRGVPAWEDRALRWSWPLAVRFVSHALGIEPGGKARDEALVWRELEFVAELLADGRPYLLGDRFSAADLTFAALAAAVVLPSDYGTPLPQPDVLAPATAELVHRARAHPAGAFALSLVERERRARVRPRQPVA
jgi:glutathione S-transferase